LIDATENCFKHFSPQGWQDVESHLIAEAPVGLTVNGDSWLTFLCTPVLLEALALGFLYNEGAIANLEEVAQVRACDDQTNVDVWLTHAAQKPAHWLRASGCTGGATSAEALRVRTSLIARSQFLPQVILAGMEELYHVEGLYQEYRGLHASALYGGEGIRFHAADIGRHNTLDKLTGQWLQQGGAVPPLLLTTGRISAEMMGKSARLGVEVVVSRTTPTRLAVELASALQVTLVGYARRDQFIVYTHPDRILS
jgi:FdhD protein